MRADGGSSNRSGLDPFYSSNDRSQEVSATAKGSIIPRKKQCLSLLISSGKSLLSRHLSTHKVGLNKRNKVTLNVKKVSAMVNIVTGVFSCASFITMLGMRVVKVVRGTSSVARNGFKQSFKVVERLNYAGECVSLIKSSSAVVYNTVMDVVLHKKRRKARRLLNKFNAATRELYCGGSSNANKLKIQRLMSEAKSDLSKSKTQVAFNRISQIAMVSNHALCLAYTGLTLAKNSALVAKKMLTRLGIVVSVLDTIKSGINTASQISALNNLANAQNATKDPLLIALGNHIKHERTLKAREYLVETVINTASTALNATLTSTLAGASIGYIANGVFSGAFFIGNTAFQSWHNHNIEKKRKHADYLMKLGRPLNSVAAKNIGVAERVFLDKLQHANGDQLAEIVTFLRNFGLTDASIKKLQFSPEEIAISYLRKVLYHDKVNYKGLQLKKTIKSLVHVVGLGALGRKIKMGSLWLKAKLSSNKGTQSLRYFGRSMQSDPPLSMVSTRDSYQFKQAVANQQSAKRYLNSRSLLK